MLFCLCFMLKKGFINYQASYGIYLFIYFFTFYFNLTKTKQNIYFEKPLEDFV